jgi:branched-chain amino acid transport system ATP-binding protein
MAGMNMEEKKQDMSFIPMNDEFGTTIVFEHDMGVVMDISTAWSCWTTAKKIGDGTPEEVRNNEDDQRVLGTSH